MCNGSMWGFTVAFPIAAECNAPIYQKMCRGGIQLGAASYYFLFCPSYSSFSQGVEIPISKNLAFRSLDCIKDNQGRYIIVKGILSLKKVAFMYLYCPSPGLLQFLWDFRGLFCWKRFQLSPQSLNPPDISTPCNRQGCSIVCALILNILICGYASSQ